ncbi:hypothetical protein GO730_36875 [Spirosoma sp. HMF3257]|nr:hypothetical protein [Spirosoma telluris]
MKLSLEITALLSLALAILSCTSASLDGNYINSTDSTDTLKLFSDSHYTRKSKESDTIKENKGTWDSDDIHKLFLHNWYDKETKEHLTYGLIINRKSFSQDCELVYDIDQNFYYKKQQ